MHADEAFRSGADDFIHKMLGLRSLVNRIHLVLNNHLIIKKRIAEFQIGTWLLSRKDCSVSHRSRHVKLAPEEFEVIYFIAQNSYHTLTRDQVDKFLDGSSALPTYATMDKCIDRLFSKLGKEWIIWKGKNRFQFNEGY
jgi:DNA-binding response OmpR family regulator